jgi:drug/metabolite transporter (DMT)-like permease
MDWLMLTILCAVFNFLLFKQFERWQVNTLLAVSSNYLMCIGLGFLLPGEIREVSIHTPWLPWAFFIGFLFVVIYVLIGISSRTLGVNATTVASKMSFVIPMGLAYGLYQANFTWLHLLALILALTAVFFNSKITRTTRFSGLTLVLPMAIFFGGGMADAALNYVEVKLLPPHQQGAFLMALFGTSGLFGWLAIGINRLQGRQNFNFKSFGIGLLLGCTNFGSIYALLKAFRSEMNGAFIFPILNVGIILLAGVGAWLIFKEKPTPKQSWGMLMAILSILIYSAV